MDALSEALRAVRVRSALFFTGEFSAPWHFATPSQKQVAPALAPGAEHLVLFHLVTAGEASARTSDHDDVALAPADLIVFPHGDAHDLWNGETAELFPSARVGGFFRLAATAGAASAVAAPLARCFTRPMLNCANWS